jgi:hypothetical protein
MKRPLERLALVPALLALSVGTAEASDIGKAKTVHDGAGDVLSVTIVKTKPFKAYGPFGPDVGMKWFGAYIEVRNLSNHTSQRCINDWLKLRHSLEAIFDANDKPELNCPTTRPEKTSAGWIVWTLKKSVNPTIIDWIVDSSSTHEKVTWKLH